MVKVIQVSWTYVTDPSPCRPQKLHSWMLALCLGLFVWNKIRWKNFNCLLFYTKVYRPVKRVGGVALSQQCHDVYNTVTTFSTLYRIVVTFERRCSTDVQTEFSSTSLRYCNVDKTRFSSYTQLLLQHFVLQTRSDQNESLCYFVQVFMYVTTAV